jgi:CRP/FNR family cyclic AMP-dependent transcriptional regulator
MEDVELLKRYNLFQHVSENDLKRLARIVEEKKFSGGEIIFNPGEKGGTLYFIKTGTVEISLPILGTKQYKRVSILGPGECFGELSFLDENEHSARAKAIEDVELLVITNENYLHDILEDKRAEIELEIKMVIKVINILRNMNKEYSLRPFA